MMTLEEKEMFRKMLNDHRIIPKALVCGTVVFEKLESLSEDEKTTLLKGVPIFRSEEQKPEEVFLIHQHSPTWHPIYDKDGYDELGYNKEGYHRNGFKRW